MFLNFSLALLLLVPIQSFLQNPNGMLYQFKSSMNKYDFFEGKPTVKVHHSTKHGIPTDHLSEENNVFKILRASILAFFSSSMILLSENIPCNAVTQSSIEKTRFDDSLKELKNLDKNWDTIIKGGGDNIRRRLGTVYTPPTCSSPLCSFPSFLSKFAKAHVDDLDVSAYEDPSQNLMQALNQADFLAYSSIFSEYGNGGGGKDYIELSHKQIKQAILDLEDLLEVIKE